MRASLRVQQQPNHHCARETKKKEVYKRVNIFEGACEIARGVASFKTASGGRNFE
jgi:hypothetical protein